MRCARFCLMQHIRKYPASETTTPCPQYMYTGDEAHLWKTRALCGNCAAPQTKHAEIRGGLVQRWPLIS